MPDLYLGITNRCEDHHALQLSDVGLLVIRHFEEVNEEALELPVSLAELKLFALKHQEWFDLSADSLGNEG